MKKGVLLGLAGLFLLFFLFSSTFVSAAASKDVGYILISKRNANKQITDVFSSLNLTYDLIEDSKINSVYKAGNLSKYQFLFIDDVRLNNARKIPIYNYPSVIMNKYYGYEWGLTDRDGISQMTSTSPLNVNLVSDGREQVYTQAKFSGIGTHIPFYYLSDENKANFMSVARAFEGGGSDGEGEIPNEFGDAIAYANSGVNLINGKTSKGKICFFGIAKTPYWTDDAKNLFLDCIGYVGTRCRNDSECPSQPEGNTYCHNDDVYQSITQLHCENPGTVHSACVDGAAPELIEDCDDNNANTEDSCVQTINNATCAHTPIKCFDNSDCGADGFSSNLFCTDNKTLSQNFITFTCNNPGLTSSYCSNLTETMLNETCSDTCLDGKCRTIKCYTDLDCDDDNLWTKDKCLNPGTILSECVHNNITCFNNLDCGTNTLSGASCSGLNVVKNYLNFTCTNPGTSSSSCSNLSGSYNIQTCPQQCSLGKCININCTKDADCNDGNAKTVDQCAFAGTPSSFCRNTEVNCMSDIDCGFTGFSGNEYCFQDDAFKNFQASVCSNPGTLNSSCTINIGSQFLQDCGSDSCGNFSNYCKNDDVYKIRTCFDKGCSQGSCFNNVNYDDVFASDCDYGCSQSQGICLPQCTQNSDCGNASVDIYCSGSNLTTTIITPMCMNGSCGLMGNTTIIQCDFGCANNACLPGIHDVALVDFSQAVNNIRIKNETNSIVNNIMCNRDYKFEITAENLGDFYENVTFSGSIGGLALNHVKIDNFAPGDSSLKSKTINVNLASGFYNVTINAFIPADSNLANNIASRQIEVICPSCFSNSDCGSSTSFLNCSGSNVVNITTTPTCSQGNCVNVTNSTITENCPYGCSAGECVINCYNNSDCGNNGFIGNLFCSSNDLFRNFTTFTCNNADTKNSFCSDSTLPQLNQDCGNDSYSDYGANYCAGDDVYHNRTFYDRGCLIDSCFDNPAIQVENITHCDHGCSQGVCNQPVINCTQTSDCGVGTTSPVFFCKGDEKWVNSSSVMCFNANTTSSYCGMNPLSNFVENCSYGCSNGNCLPKNCTDYNPPNSGLVGYWKFENNFFDSSGNGNNGVGNNVGFVPGKVCMGGNFNDINYEYTTSHAGSSNTAVNCQTDAIPSGYSFVKRECVHTLPGEVCNSDICLWKKPTVNNYEYKITNQESVALNEVDCSLSPAAGYTLKKRECLFSGASVSCYSDVCLWEKAIANKNEYTITHAGSVNTAIDCSTMTSPGSGYSLANRVCVLTVPPSQTGAGNCVSDVCLWKKPTLINSYAQINDSNSLDLKNYTTEAWFKINSLPAGDGVFIILAKGEDTSTDVSNYGIDLIKETGLFGSSWVIWCGTEGSGTDNHKHLVYPINNSYTNRFVHVACTLEGRNWKIYVDGVDKTSDPQTRMYAFRTLLPDKLLPIGFIPVSTTSQLFIGAGQHGPIPGPTGTKAGFFPGVIDEVAIYNRALSASEILNNYNNGLNPCCSNNTGGPGGN